MGGENFQVVSAAYMAWYRRCRYDEDCWYEHTEYEQGRRAERVYNTEQRARVMELRKRLGETGEKHSTRKINWVRLGITNPPNELDYYEMLVAADGHCPLCHRPGGKRNLQLHHNHKTGKVVGLLCGRCNMGMGQFEDDPELLELAADYLRTWHWEK